ncbi:hypothetical protein KUV28_21110 [Ferrimonas balearica]|nr:hypothetical protein [Ferrimonas balearica]
MELTYYCGVCRSEELSFVARAMWCHDAQEMELEVPDDSAAYCLECVTQVSVGRRTEDGGPLTNADLFEDET